MAVAYILIFGTIGVLSITVVVVFAWAIRTGQFADFQQGATSIFDDDEPLGEMTDWFPDQGRRQTPDSGAAARSKSTPNGNKTDVDHA